MVAEHRAIVAALRARDADRAAAVFSDHLASSRAAVASVDASD